MRTTLTIDDDVLAAAKALATMQNKSVGEVISALTRQALRPNAQKSKSRNGVPLLPVRAGAVAVTPELVNQLRDELPG
ncbi:MAG: CopG family transcriptional regulator [Betaproteobacteria bacterium]